MFVKRMKEYFYQNGVEFFEQTRNGLFVLSIVDLGTFSMDKEYISDIVFTEDEIVLEFANFKNDDVCKYHFQDIIDVILLLEKIYTYSLQKSQLAQKKSIILSQLTKAK